METIVLAVLAVALIVAACLWVCNMLDAAYGLDLVAEAKDSHKYEEALAYYRAAVKGKKFWGNTMWIITGVLIITLGVIGK